MNSKKKKNNRKISRKIRKSKKLKGGSLSRAERAARAAAAANRRAAKRRATAAAANESEAAYDATHDFPLIAARAESARSESARAESARAESARSESARAESGRAESARAESARAARMIRSQSYSAIPSIINGRQIRKQLSLNSSFEPEPLTGRRNNKLIISKAKRNQSYNTRYLMNETEKRLMPFPETRLGDPFGYPIEGTNWTYEENPADGNCLYYSVLRALERRIIPNEEPLRRGELGSVQHDILYDKYAAYILKKLAREHSPTNRALMTTPVLHPSGYLQSLMADRTYGEPASIQALSNLLNCCICVFMRKGMSPSIAIPPLDSNAWQIYIPDSQVAFPAELVPFDEGINIPMRDGAPSFITLTERIDPLQYTEGIPPVELASNGYHTDPQRYRDRMKQDRLSAIKFVEQHCHEPLYISSIGDPAGHFVVLEYLHERNKKRHFTSGYTTEPLSKDHNGYNIYRQILTDKIKITNDPDLKAEINAEMKTEKKKISSVKLSKPTPSSPANNLQSKVDTLVNMGFDNSIVTWVLKETNGDINRAINILSN